jgi:2-keto-4-pentenoate hydratase/2-oxohepta-3-ene-1,7-dioic acid hydratase in catechol pathway
MLTTKVNGVVRQKTSSKDLLLSPSQLLARAKSVLGRELARGDVILTGTPRGIGFDVGRTKRWLGSKLLDRFGRLEAAFATYAKSEKLLRPGDRVEVEAGFLGRRTVQIALRD